MSITSLTSTTLSSTQANVHDCSKRHLRERIWIVSSPHVGALSSMPVVNVVTRSDALEPCKFDLSPPNWRFGGQSWARTAAHFRLPDARRSLSQYCVQSGQTLVRSDRSILHPEWLAFTGIARGGPKQRPGRINTGSPSRLELLALWHTVLALAWKGRICLLTDAMTAPIERNVQVSSG